MGELYALPDIRGVPERKSRKGIRGVSDMLIPCVGYRVAERGV